MVKVVGEIGNRRVVKIISGEMKSVGFIFSNCHFIFILLIAGSIVIEVV